ncbi:MAG: acyl-homoserine-lactone synthase [Rickettsiales bacterium]
MNTRIITIENMHKYGDVMPSMLRLRYKEFKARQNYDVPVFKEMEYDVYDTPAAVYVVWQDDDGIVRGCSRMSPTDRPYMIKDIWPGMVTRINMPEEDSIWESSRFAIDSELSASMRQRVKLEILQAKIEFALSLDIKGMIGVMPPLIWRAVFVNSGWPINNIGEVTILDSGEKVVAGWINVNREILDNIKNRTEIYHSLIEDEEVLHRESVNIRNLYTTINPSKNRIMEAI